MISPATVDVELVNVVAAVAREVIKIFAPAWARVTVGIVNSISKAAPPPMLPPVDVIEAVAEVNKEASPPVLSAISSTEDIVILSEAAVIIPPKLTSPPVVVVIVTSPFPPAVIAVVLISPEVLFRFIDPSVVVDIAVAFSAAPVFVALYLHLQKLRSEG